MKKVNILSIQCRPREAAGGDADEARATVRRRRRRPDPPAKGQSMVIANAVTGSAAVVSAGRKTTGGSC